MNNSLIEQLLADIGGPQSPDAVHIHAGEAIHNLIENARKVNPMLAEQLEKDLFEQALASGDIGLLKRFGVAHMLDQIPNIDEQQSSSSTEY